MCCGCRKVQWMVLEMKVVNLRDGGCRAKFSKRCGERGQSMKWV